MDNERKIELVKEFYELKITTDISDFENVDCNIYNECTSDGYDIYVVTNNPNQVSVCEDVHYYDNNLTERFNDHVRWGDRTFYICEYIYKDCYFEDYIAEDMFDDLVNGNDFSYFLETVNISWEELYYLKEEYGIEDEKAV